MQRSIDPCFSECFEVRKMAAHVVIGSNYGDEGKGAITDYLTKRLQSPLVCRFNGGAQAGHTVTKPYGIEHVFSHVGAGTFENADTYLGSNFIVNPYLLNKELDKLDNKVGYVPTIYCHPKAMVTTIYDMAINVIIESLRDNRHGSCGVGINETVTRNHDGFKLTVDQLQLDTFELVDIIRDIHKNWVPRRLARLNITDISEELHEKTGNILLNDNYIHHVDILKQVLDDISIGVPTNMDWNNVIFEGAQGLGLDEYLGNYPNVTRSMTGLPFAIDTAIENGLTEIQPVYVSRCYTTRHGNGQLAYENEFITGSHLEDTTNVENEWQGKLRYAPLNLKYMKELINKDLARSSSKNIKINTPVLAITCLDQIRDSIIVYDTNGNKKELADSNQLINLIEQEIGYKVQFMGYGYFCINNF